jgi:multimeric flavodoxin WrbA
VAILSGSGRPHRNATSYHFARHLAEGMAGGAAAPRVRLVHLRDLSFGQCRGCFGCWRNGGECTLDDDYTSLVAPLLESADLMVLAFPIYFYGFPPEITHAVTRLFSNLHPTYRWDGDEGTLVHNERRPCPGSLFLLGTGGLLDTTQFDIPMQHARLLARRHGIRFLEGLFRPTGNLFLVPAARTPALDDVEAAIERAGTELVDTGAVSERTRERVQRRLLSPAQFRAAGHAFEAMLGGRFEHPLPTTTVERSRFDVMAGKRSAREAAHAPALQAEA